MEHPSRPRRLALATVALGAAVGLIAPQWVAATPGDTATDSGVNDTPALTAPGRLVSADAVAGPIGATIADPAIEVVEVPAPVVEAPMAPVPVVPDVPAAPDVPPPPPERPEPPAAPPAPSPEPAAAEAATTGAITVEVAAQDGATRTVSLQTPAGDPVGERVTVTGAPISFTDLAPGTFELFVEQVADGGGAFLTRTVVTIEAGEHAVLSCDPESLDCTR